MRKHKRFCVLLARLHAAETESKALKQQHQCHRRITSAMYLGAEALAVAALAVDLAFLLRHRARVQHLFAVRAREAHLVPRCAGAKHLLSQCQTLPYSPNSTRKTQKTYLFGKVDGLAASRALVGGGRAKLGCGGGRTRCGVGRRRRVGLGDRLGDRLRGRRSRRRLRVRLGQHASAQAETET